jgi:hypothetical protein
MAKERINLSVDPEWSARVRNEAARRKVAMSRLVMDAVTDYLDGEEEIVAAASNPVFMEAMRGMFANPQVMQTLVELVHQKGVDSDQLKLFGNGLDAFSNVIQDGKKKGKKK